MKKYVLDQLQEKMKKKQNNVIPCIWPEGDCDYAPNQRKISCTYGCMLDEDSCYDDKKFFFKKSKEKIDQISDKYAAIAIQMNCTYQFWTIRDIAGYAKQKGLITIVVNSLFSSVERMRRYAREDSNVDIIELIHTGDIEEYEQMLKDIKKNNKAVIIPHTRKYDKNTNHFPLSTDYEATRERMKQIKNEKLKGLYDRRQVTGYDWYPNEEEPIEYFYEDRIQFVRATGSLQHMNEKIQLEKGNYNVGIIVRY